MTRLQKRRLTKLLMKHIRQRRAAQGLVGQIVRQMHDAVAIHNAREGFVPRSVH